MSANMKRREFIALLSGAAAAWPLAARAQQGERMRRIGVLTPFAANDAEGQARLTAFAQGLHHWGWIVGQNIRIEYRWGDGKADTMRKYATELVALAPDVILASSSAAVAPLGGEPHRPDRIRGYRRPGWRRVCREPSAAGRQRHRLCNLRIFHQREMAGAAQGGRAARDASGGSS